MKVLTILFFASSVIAEPFIKSCGEHYIDFPERKNSPESIVDHWNGDRSEFMRICQISNMHQLKYDKSLEEEIRKMKSCKDIVHGSNYRVSWMVDRKGIEVIQKVAEKRKEQFDRSREKSQYTIPAWLELPEMLHPTQTSMAWCDINEVCNDEFVNYENKSLNHPKARIIVYGPKGTYDESDFKYGEPGTDCPNGPVGPFTKWCKGSEDNRVVPFLGVFLIFSFSFLMNFV